MEVRSAPSVLTDPAAPQLRPLQNTGVGFLALEMVGAVAVFATYSIAVGDPPESCRWCRPTGFDESLRDALVFDKSARKSAATVSHVLSAGAIPAAAFAALLVPALSEGKGGYALEDAWIMFNTFLLTTGITDGTKKLVGRRRPAFYHGEQNHTEGGENLLESNLSFFSGDTAWAFSFAASASTLAFMRGNRLSPFIAGGGGVLALGTGFLRIAADAHWTTDVLTGALVGTGFGVAVPLLLHRPVERGAPSVHLVPWVGRATGVELALSL
jgi:membrane-associated phospholipid phosphatase